MKRLVFVGLVLGTMAVFLAACLVVVATLVWVARQWEPASWVIWVVGLGLMGVAVAVIWRWWRLPVEGRFRFSLRGMLVGITLFALWIGTVGDDFRQWSRKNRAHWAIIHSGGHLKEEREWNQTSSFASMLLFRLTGYYPWWKAHEAYVMSDVVLSVLLENADELPELKQVYFIGPRVTDAGMAQIGGFDRFPDLHFCQIKNSQVTDAGLKHLSEWRNLRGLNLDGCVYVTDAGLAHLVELNLERLLLWNGGSKTMPITDAGLAHVGRMSSLQFLSIDAPVGDAGMQQLHGLVNLERISLEGTRVSEKGYGELCEALPDCLVEWNGARHPHLCQIERIEVWHSAPSDRRIVVFTDREQIVAVIEWLEQYEARPELSSGWRQEDYAGPSGASLSLRFEGEHRTIQEIPIGNGVYHMNRMVYRPMSLADERELCDLLGIPSEEREGPENHQ